MHSLRTILVMGLVTTIFALSNEASAANFSATPGEVIQVQEGDRVQFRYGKRGRVSVKIGSYVPESSKVSLTINSTNNSGTRSSNSLVLGDADGGFIVEVLKVSSTSALITVPKSQYLD